MTRTMKKMTSATMQKSTTFWMNLPYWILASPISTIRPLKSRPPSTVPTSGMITSPTSEATILPNAPPMITPTARSTTLPLTANSRNSLTQLMGPPLWVPHLENFQLLLAGRRAQRDHVALAALQQRTRDRRDPGHVAFGRIDLVHADDDDL